MVAFRMPFLVLILSLFWMTFLVSCVSNEKKLTEAFLRLRNGTALYSQGHYPQALAELRTAASLDRANPKIHNQLGLTYMALDRPDRAEESFQRALRVDKTFSFARANLIRLYLEENRSHDALKEVRILEEDLTYPHRLQVAFLKGQSYFQLENWDSAWRSFTRALHLNHNHCPSQIYQGRSLYEMKRLKEASQALDRAIALCHDSPQETPFFFSALSYQKLGQLAVAVARLEKMIEEFPGGQYTALGKGLLKEMR